MSRPRWDEYFLGIAEAVAARGDCTRRQVGCVVTSPDRRVISTGYNGAPPGDPGCLSDGACPRGKHLKLYSRTALSIQLNGIFSCTCGNAWPCEEYVEPGSSYDTGAGACIALHAEQNALLYAFRDVKGAIMYITDEPCGGCLKLIRGARISRVVTPSSELDLDLPLNP